MSEYTIDGKRIRKVYNEKRITMTAKTPDGKTVTTKSTGVDAKGLHYVTPSDSARLDFKASGKVKFGLSQGLPIDYANADKKGKADLLTKEVSDDVINRKAARNRAEYQQKQAQKEKEKREKSKRKTRKKLTSIKGAAEKVNAGSYAGGILTLDAATGTVFTHDLQSQPVGLVSITNFPVVTNSFHTVTVIYNQNSAGTGNTTAATGISTNITLNPAGASGFSTTGLVGSGTTITLSTTAEDFDVVTYGIHYNGSGSGAVGNYKVFVTKSGDFRY